MRKITEEEFSKYLNAFAEGNIALIHGAITLVTNDGLYSERLSDVPRYMKSSLIRKVLRYVAKTALKGTFEIDGLSVSCSFCEMANGDPVSFGSTTEWSFDHKGQLINVTIDSTEDVVYYYDKYSQELWHCDIPYGCHWTTLVGRIDIVKMFEHWDLVARR
jgi:hypothetical protein